MIYLDSIPNNYYFEFNWSLKSKNMAPRQFIESYPTSSFNVINPENFDSFLI